jgi:hypothetical protein
VRPATSFVAMGLEWVVACVAFLSVLGLILREVSKRNGSGSSCKAGLGSAFIKELVLGKGEREERGQRKRRATCTSNHKRGL